jgi:hypothetical protein
MAAPVINTPAHLEHRIKTPDGRTLAVAEWGDPDGLPVIAMHGTPGGRITYWDDPTIYAHRSPRSRSMGRHVLRRTLDARVFAARLGEAIDWLTAPPRS